MCGSLMSSEEFYRQEGNEENLFEAKSSEHNTIMNIHYLLMLPLRMLFVWLLEMPCTPWDLLEKWTNCTKVTTIPDY